MIRSFTTAIRTLTVIPIPGPDTENRTASLPFFPIIGLIIGGVLYAIMHGCSLLWRDFPLLGGLIVTFASVLLTGALHLDGIADVADAFGGAKSKERILDILKDSRHGTFGVAAIAFDLLARVLLIAWCIQKGHGEIVVAAAVFSRSAMAWTCTIIPYARPEGGTADSFMTGKPPRLLLQTTFVIFAVVLVFTEFFPIGTIILVAGVPVQLFLLSCLKKIDGITGDCLGTVNEIGELGVLLAGTVIYNY